jgi:hypothetical protein
MLSRTLCSIIAPADQRSYQYTAVLGDLLHKTDVYVHFGDYGPVPEPYFTNFHQATYLRNNYPELVPPPASPGQLPSDHTLGTIFEFHYYISPAFRSRYLAHLPRRSL